MIKGFPLLLALLIKILTDEKSFYRVSWNPVCGPTTKDINVAGQVTATMAISNFCQALHFSPLLAVPNIIAVTLSQKTASIVIFTTGQNDKLISSVAYARSPQYNFAIAKVWNLHRIELIINFIAVVTYI